MNNEELTPKERRALEALPSEKRPSRLLEERVVRALRAEGVLAPARGVGIVIGPARAALATAAVVLLAAGSFALGHRAGSRQTLEIARAVQEENGKQIAALVQQTGSAYVAALGSLMRAGAMDPEGARQGREAAVAALYAASHQVARLAPEDAIARNILWALSDPVEARGPAGDLSEDQIIWF
ncbi:MAG: hypothetical protein ABIH26_04350 [Candidatus Eisenbacteria bacterium]